MEEISTKFSFNDNKEKNLSKNIKLKKQTYRIFGFILVILLSLLFILLSIFLFCKGIYDIKNSHFEINDFVGSIILILLAGIMTYYFPLFSSITIDMNKKLVIIKKYRFIFLNNKTTKIETDKIIRAYTEKNKEEGYGRNQNSYDGFDLIFILNDGHRIVGLEGEIDKNNERKKLDYFLRQFFPGSLDNDSSSIYIQLQNFNSQNKEIKSPVGLEQNQIKNEQNKNQYNIFLGIQNDI